MKYLLLIRYKDGNGNEFAEWSLKDSYFEARDTVRDWPWGSDRRKLKDWEIVKVNSCEEEQEKWNRDHS